jgi:outer membrane immunogenic protein
MRNLLMTGAAAAALGIAAPALGADLALKAPPPPVPVFTWTGFYLGVNGGFGWNKRTADTFCVAGAGIINGPGCTNIVAGNLRPEGWLFGGQVGYNWQTGPIVLGLEADLQWSDIHDSIAIGGPFPLVGGGVSGPATYTASQRLEWFGTARGRAGWAFDRTLAYVTGGLIYGREAVTQNLVFPVTGITYPAAASSVRTGWVVGGGLEYAFTNNVTGRAEGLWYDMGDQTIANINTATGFTRATTFNYTGGIIRGAVNYKF